MRGEWIDPFEGFTTIPDNTESIMPKNVKDFHDIHIL